ncbi:MAG: NAD+ synthase [Candidatus Hydrothermia bacterium]|jgi:NAD+ synthase (glutamine-hydrolysing)|nr:NAD+ synthase [Candidatus Hydrothermia bacterium]
MNLRVAICQINSKIGDFEYNMKKILEFIEKSREYNADLIVFPELALTGYLIEDLALRPSFINQNIKTLKKISQYVNNEVVIIGFVNEKNGFIYNSAGILYKGEIIGTIEKFHLPNYLTFDEKRIFKGGQEYKILNISGYKVGIVICQDIWHPDGPMRKYSIYGIDLGIVINGSPYHVSKQEEREHLIISRNIDNLIPIIYVNLVGGEDDLVFDGRSFVVNDGKVISRAKAFEEDLMIIDIPKSYSLKSKIHQNRLNEHKLDVEIKEIFINKELKNNFQFLGFLNENPIFEEEVYKAVLLGLKDYVLKSGFNKVIVGISGGIDSALTTVLCVDAFGNDNVIGVWMGSKYNKIESYEDAKMLSKNLHIEFLEFNIDKIFESYILELKKSFKNYIQDKTEENLQSRIRGNILMSLSNKFNALVISTGNKSEYAVGYATLYGDMVGAYAPLKDVYKTWIYRIAKWRNEKNNVIPERIFKKRPSAELRENQYDEDEIGSYEILDKIIKFFVEDDLSKEEILKFVNDESYLNKVLEMIRKNEFKRKQSPLGPKITKRAFYRDRRYPNTNIFL